MVSVGSLPRVQRRRTAQQARILAAARQSFAERGPAAVRLDEIADRADIARGTLYSHFATKEALLVALVEPALLATERGLAAIRAEDDADVVMGAMLRLWHRLWRDHRDALRIAHGVGANLPEALRPVHRRVVSQMHRLLVKLEQSGRLRGDAEWASMLIAKLGVPLLETYERIDETERTFVECASRLLLATAHSNGRRARRKADS